MTRGYIDGVLRRNIMTARELSDRLHGRKHSGYYMASCPVHGAAGGDRNPSLSIWDDGDRVAINCHAGCEWREVVKALGLTSDDLGHSSDHGWKRRIKTIAVRPAGARKPLGNVEAIYRYTDEHGELMAEKLRYEGKVFLWRRPQAGGGWLWKIDRAALPLYMLHELVHAKTCVLTEGEKDVETIRGVGMVATTAPNGAKSWRPEFAQKFKGKRVFILPDNDAPGIKYAHEAAKAILTFAKSVRIVYLPDGKDVTDYLSRHTASELGKLMRTQ